MKIAIATNGKSLEDKVVLHFGRARSFLIYDTEMKDFDIHSNPEVAGGTEFPPDFLYRLGVETVIVFSLGSKAFEKFKNYKIEMYKAVEDTILENLQKFKKGELKKIGEEDIF
jgi:predicted Fe-Mo cluster-binding NifX family protein